MSAEPTADIAGIELGANLSHARAALPAARYLEVIARPRGINQPSRHAAMSTMPGGWRRQLLTGADAVDPGINVISIDIKTCIEFSTRLGDHLGLPHKASKTFGLGLAAGDNGCRLDHDGNVSHRRAVF